MFISWWLKVCCGLGKCPGQQLSQQWVSDPGWWSLQHTVTKLTVMYDLSSWSIKEREVKKIKYQKLNASSQKGHTWLVNTWSLENHPESISISSEKFQHFIMNYLVCLCKKVRKNWENYVAYSRQNLSI